MRAKKLKLSDEMREKFRAESPTLIFCDEPCFQLCDQATFDRVWATLAIPAIERNEARKATEEERVS